MFEGNIKKMKTEIAIAKTEKEIMNCYPVMVELRPHLMKADFLSLVNHLNKLNGFQLVYLYNNGIKAVAGIRISQWLAYRKYLEIEDLVTKAHVRSKGYGGALFDWIIDYAKKNNCDQVRLISNIKRTDAHRFYKRKDMILKAYYFSLNVK